MNGWQLRKKSNWFDNRAKFSKDEVRELNIAAYALGVAHFMEATAELYGLGSKRLEATKASLERVSYLDLHAHAGKFSMFNLRNHYTKYEARRMIFGAYSLGIEHTREAVGYAYRFGEVRLAKIDAKLLELQKQDMTTSNKTGNIFEARLMRATRRANRNSKKGAVLDDQKFEF